MKFTDLWGRIECKSFTGQRRITKLWQKWKEESKGRVYFFIGNVKLYPVWKCSVTLRSLCIKLWDALMENGEAMNVLMDCTNQHTERSLMQPEPTGARDHSSFYTRIHRTGHSNDQWGQWCAVHASGLPESLPPQQKKTLSCPSTGRLSDPAKHTFHQEPYAVFVPF